MDTLEFHVKQFKERRARLIRRSSLEQILSYSFIVKSWRVTPEGLTVRATIGELDTLTDFCMTDDTFLIEAVA